MMGTGETGLTGRALSWMIPTTFTLLFVALNVLAFEAFATRQLVILGGIIGGGALIYAILPKSIFLPLALTNGLVVYTWVYVFFTRLNFERASQDAITLAYPLPIAAFIIGVLVWRREIVDLVSNLINNPGSMFFFLVVGLPVLAGAAVAIAHGYSCDRGQARLRLGRLSRGQRRKCAPGGRIPRARPGRGRADLRERIRQR